ncbi:MAG: cupin domain-containing protein [Halobacteriales archaeon]
MSEFTGPAVGRREDAPTYRFLDNLAYVLVSGDETDGRRAVVEMHQPAGHMTPMHVHEGTDETLHVLEGGITAHMEDTTRQVTAGGTVVLPRGRPHALVADEPSVVLVSNSPAGFDEFVAAAGEPTDDETVPTPPPSEEAIERVRDVAPEHGIEIVGPPPAQQ